MLTELKKTIHVVTKDPNEMPDETMIQHALNQNVQAMVTPGTMATLVFEEYSDALAAAQMEDCGAHTAAYRVWTVDMHFTRSCPFKPQVRKQFAL